MSDLGGPGRQSPQPAGPQGPEPQDPGRPALEGLASPEAGPGTSAPGAPPQPAAAKARGSVFEILLVVLLALSIALLLKVYVAEAYEIRGKSMENTFREEERVMVLKVFYEVHRGDVVIFSSKENPSKDLIKRVIGLPGDHVEVKDGRVVINGESLDEPYVKDNLDFGYHEYKQKRVPEGKYYVLGDNRRDSQDSRVFDVIDAASIKGRVVFRWWPIEKLGSF